MIIKLLKAYLEKHREQKRISQQYILEKKCVDYFNKDMLRMTNFTRELVKTIDVKVNSIPIIAKFNKDKFSIQAVNVCKSFDNKDIELYYGQFLYSKTPEWFALIKDLPEELWMSVEEYSRPTRPVLLLCDYDANHYEVVEYADKEWVTELCFPVQPTRYFVLEFLTENR